MDGAINPASIAILIVVGSSLLAGFFSLRVAMRSRGGAVVNCDMVASILFGIAIVLIVLIVVAAARIVAWGMAYVGLLKAALLLTAAFAVTGVAFGLMRGLLSGRWMGKRRDTHSFSIKP